MTSRYPAHFGGDGGKVSYRIPDNLPSIAEILTAQGYDSAAVSASSIVRATPSRVNHEGGYGGGFRIFDEECMMLGADCVNARALPLLDELSEPFSSICTTGILTAPTARRCITSPPSSTRWWR